MGEQAERFSAAAGLDCNLILPSAEDEQLVPAQVRHDLLGLAKEALAKVARPAGARKLVLEIRAPHDRLCLIIINDGVGFDPSRVFAGSGLRNLRERLEATYGTFGITIEPRMYETGEEAVRDLPAVAPEVVLSASAPAENNDDKRIETHFITVGTQYMFSRSWGAQLELPIVNRTFDSAANAGSINWTGLGDIRLKCLYTGFSDDLSSGVSLGLKLPTGSYTQTDPLGDIDRDTQIGSGSTDFLFGGFYRHALGKNSHWEWFAQAELDVPVAKQGDYRPGVEVNAAGGIDYRGWNWGRVTITPIFQIIGSVRGHDCGAAAAPDDSGYQRILLAPGIEVNLHPVMIYADVELPVYQNFTGNQLVTPVLFKVGLSFMF